MAIRSCLVVCFCVVAVKPHGGVYFDGAFVHVELLPFRGQ